jgi:hypothetical protein
MKTKPTSTFTLVEVLILIGITAVLVAILIPGILNDRNPSTKPAPPPTKTRISVIEFGHIDHSTMNQYPYLVLTDSVSHVQILWYHDAMVILPNPEGELK